MTLRTSPKLFKSTPIQGQYLENNSTHHSTISSASQPTSQSTSAAQLSHVAETCENGVETITGIKRGKSQVKNRTNVRKAAVVVELVSIAPEVQANLFYVPPLSPMPGASLKKLSREERIAQRKVQLRRRVQQFKGIQHYRTTERSKMRFSKTLKLLRQLDRAKEEM